MIRQALLDHLVLFFRDQHITDEQQLAFALRVRPDARVAARRPSTRTRPRSSCSTRSHPKGEGADEWHSDNTFLAEPPMGSILRAVQLPDGRRRHVLREHVRGVRRPLAGDARRSSTACARSTTSPSRCRRRSATATPPSTSPRCSRSARRSSTTSSVTHPETGRKALFVNRNSTTHIVGLTDRENDVLLPFLFDHVRSPEFQCRFHWEEGSIAFWDNRAVQHYAVADYHERRIMHRATIAGPGRRDR